MPGRPVSSTIINAPPSFKDRSRGKHKGTGRSVSIEVTSEPLLIFHDMAGVEGAAARAVQRDLKRQIMSVSRKVKSETIERRARYAREFAAGAKTAVRRFKGSARSEIGEMRPKPNEVRWLNDSGRLARSIKATFNPRAGGDTGVLNSDDPKQKTHKTGGWTINVAENRLNAHDYGPSRFEWFLGEVGKLISTKKATESRAYTAAVEGAMEDVIAHLRGLTAAKRLELQRAYGRVVRDSISVVLSS